MDYALRGSLPPLRRTLGECPGSSRRLSRRIERWRRRALEPTPAATRSSQAVAVPGSARHKGRRPWVRWCTVHHPGLPGGVTRRVSRLRQSIWPRIPSLPPLGLFFEGSGACSSCQRENCHTAWVWQHGSKDGAQRHGPELEREHAPLPLWNMYGLRLAQDAAIARALFVLRIRRSQADVRLRSAASSRALK